MNARGARTAAKCTLLTVVSHNGVLLFTMLFLCLCAWDIMCNTCCKAFSNHGNCIITQLITRAHGLTGDFVTRINIFENDVTRVSLFCFYTAVCTIDNIPLNVTRMLVCTDTSISLTYFQKVGKPLRHRKIRLSLYTFITKDYVGSTITALYLIQHS